VLFFSIGEGAIVADDHGRITRVNKVALDILGYGSDDMLGKWFPETLIAEEEDGRVIPNIERPITEAFMSGKPVFRRLYYRRADGSRVPVALTVSPVLKNDTPIGAIELFRDITDEMRLEHAKDEFISIASHQLRTPASVVKQYLGMILEGYVDSPAEQLQMLKIAYEHNNNQLNIINDLLNVAQAEANRLQPSYKETDLVELVREIVLAQQPEYEQRHIILRFEPAEQQAVVYADPLHIRMVFENLLSNANKYSPPRTTVLVTLHTSPQLVTVGVQDQGVGIAAGDLPRLFNKFSRLHTTTSMASGTGLGLYWAKKLVDLYGGDIAVQSKPHKGSTFRVSLPRRKPA
jgi:two-component system phosphate regulon sensor histidine kinase PhoR